ncbi:MAG: dicarboxylate/amino acid:cation symporter [Synergistaceae bacterium]|nr:dicarboxylate/amino acid:cation symporter [Synergistaceae bacterium]
MEFIVNESDSTRTVAQILEYIHGRLESLKLPSRERTRAELMSKESLLRLYEHADFSKIKRIRAGVSNFLGNITVTLRVPGEEFVFTGGLEEIIPDDDDTDNAEALQNVLLRSFGNNVVYRHSRHHNVVTVRAVRSEYAGLYKTLGALILAVITGLALRGTEAGTLLNSSFLEPVKTIFMNGLKTCAVPIVFFSIVSCIADAGNLSGLRKIGMRLLRWFLVMQVLGVVVGFGTALLAGAGKGAGLAASSQPSGAGASISLIDRVINIMPGNIVRPFSEADMLQLILLAFMIGAAISATGSKNVKNMFAELDRVFMKVTGYLIGFMPLVVFCSIASMIIAAGLDTVLSLLGLMLTMIIGFAVMNAVYCLAVRLVAGLKPSVMYRKSFSALMTAFMTCSNNAAIPDIMNASESLGISSKLYSFGVPLGVSLNKSGLCAYSAMSIIAAANMYGVNIPAMSLVSLGVSILIVTLAAPSMPGSGIISLSILLAQAGCPVEFVGLAMSIDAVVDMLRTSTTCAGNIATEIIVAKLGGELDTERYYA